MGCIYNDLMGECSLFDDCIERAGCTKNGICICDDDPDPSLICKDYKDEDLIFNWR